MALDKESPAWEAIRLMRAARSATLATSADGQPFASLATPACAPDRSMLLLLSDLSEHTRHLRADPRCSLLFCGEPAGLNPQTTPRVTITGIAEIADEPALRERFVSLHPYAALYADFTDFHLWRIRPSGGLFVGGFARAVRLRAADLLPLPAAVEAIAAAEQSIIDHCNADHPDALSAVADRPGDWRMVTADVDGFDLADGELVTRFAWSAPLESSGDIRRELVAMTAESLSRRRSE